MFHFFSLCKHEYAYYGSLSSFLLHVPCAPKSFEAIRMLHGHEMRILARYYSIFRDTHYYYDAQMVL